MCSKYGFQKFLRWVGVNIAAANFAAVSNVKLPSSLSTLVVG